MKAQLLICAQHSVWTLYFYITLFIAVLMLFLNLAAGNMAGVIGAFAVSLYGLLLNPDVFRKLFHFTESQEYRANVFCGWLSPLNQATFPMHSFGYDYLPGIGMSMFIFAILIIALIGLSAVQLRAIILFYADKRINGGQNGICNQVEGTDKILSKRKKY